jgi:hypothetical protein
MLVLFHEAQDSVLAVVTSAPARTPRDVFLHQWSAGGLRCPSTVRLNRLVTMSHRRLWAKLGRLDGEDWKRVVEAWNTHMRLFPV